MRYWPEDVPNLTRFNFRYESPFSVREMKEPLDQNV